MANGLAGGEITARVGPVTVRPASSQATLLLWLVFWTLGSLFGLELAIEAGGAEHLRRGSSARME
jgi:hypothetical protein